MAVLIKDIFPNLIRVPRTLGRGFIFYSRRNKCLLSICPECLLSIMAIRNIGSVKDMDNSDRWGPCLEGLSGTERHSHSCRQAGPEDSEGRGLWGIKHGKWVRDPWILETIGF